MQVGNTIGKGNRFLFLAFLLVETVAMSSGLAVAIVRMHQATKSSDWSALDGIPWILAFLVGDGFMLIGVAALMATQVSHPLQTITLWFALVTVDSKLVVFFKGIYLGVPESAGQRFWKFSSCLQHVGVQRYRRTAIEACMCGEIMWL